MKQTLILALVASLFLVSCTKDKEILNVLNTYNLEMESKGYVLGETIELPQEVTQNAKKITLSFGDQSTDKLVVDPKFFLLGDNAVTFQVETSSGEVLSQDATINVFAKNPEKEQNFEIVQQYPHDTSLFTQGFYLEGNNIYESDGKNGGSRLVSYPLGSTTLSQVTMQPQDVFAEGLAVVGDKIFQLTWYNKKGFIYDKNTLNLLSEFPYPGMMGEGWGLTFDGKQLIASDGSKNLYFLDSENPSTILKVIGVAGHKEVFSQLNELEYHKGFIYANVWQKPIVLKIDPAFGEVVATYDFSQLALKHTTGNDDVLNGITFKGEHMLVTGKNWPTIYEVRTN